MLADTVQHGHDCSDKLGGPQGLRQDQHPLVGGDNLVADRVGEPPQRPIRWHEENLPLNVPKTPEETPDGTDGPKVVPIDAGLRPSNERQQHHRRGRQPPPRRRHQPVRPREPKPGRWAVEGVQGRQRRLDLLHRDLVMGNGAGRQACCHLQPPRPLRGLHPISQELRHKLPHHRHHPLLQQRRRPRPRHATPGVGQRVVGDHPLVLEGVAAPARALLSVEALTDGVRPVDHVDVLAAAHGGMRLALIQALQQRPHGLHIPQVIELDGPPLRHELVTIHRASPAPPDQHKSEGD
mmetsp:Transcript_12951/g.32392  ORF Transcript_12951/g.32392 Transcript_12951/m.32392 type:complete len:294 (-) Transcript_12951:21-902(-)